MIRAILFLGFTSILSFSGYAQKDTRPIVGVAKFGSDVDTKYAGQITERVVDILINSKRFQVVDRTTVGDIKNELEFQKTENFIDSKSTTQQGVMVAADFMVTGKIGAINITRIMNVDRTVGCYKASINFTIKIVETATTLSSEAHTFESKGADRALSPEKAVEYALNTMDQQLSEYFTNNFPINVKIAKILTCKKDAAISVLIAGGKSLGLKEGNKLTVEKIEILQGKPYPTDIGELKITKISGDDFSECSVLKGGIDILSLFNASDTLNCKLIK